MKLLKKLSLSLVLCCTAFSAMATDLRSLSADALLAKVDEYRNFKDTAFSFDLQLVSEEKGKEPKTFGLHAKILDSHTSLVVYPEPVPE